MMISTNFVTKIRNPQIYS